jgi:hypothetical protein
LEYTTKLLIAPNLYWGRKAIELLTRREKRLTLPGPARYEEKVGLLHNRNGVGQILKRGRTAHGEIEAGLSAVDERMKPLYSMFLSVSLRMDIDCIADA